VGFLPSDTVACMADLEKKPPGRLSSLVAVLTATAVSLGMAIKTLARSRPYCQSDCLSYP
jgi:hypothetical protein